MKDIVITKKRQLQELKVLLVCFVIAFAMNVYAIIAYKGNWSELFWSLGFVVATTLVIYIVYSVLRIIVYLVRKSLTRK